MAFIGYARVSSQEQNEGRQIEAFRELGVDKYFIDKCSGKDAARPQLKAMREYVREGDTVIVTEYARLARSVRDLLSIIDELTKKGVRLQSIKEQLDTTTPQGKLMLTIFAGLAEFERDMILTQSTNVASAGGFFTLGRRAHQRAVYGVLSCGRVNLRPTPFKRFCAAFFAVSEGHDGNYLFSSAKTVLAPRLLQPL